MAARVSSAAFTSGSVQKLTFARPRAPADERKEAAEVRSLPALIARCRQTADLTNSIYRMKKRLGRSKKVAG